MLIKYFNLCLLIIHKEQLLIIVLTFFSVETVPQFFVLISDNILYILIK